MDRKTRLIAGDKGGVSKSEGGVHTPHLLGPWQGLPQDEAEGLSWRACNEEETHSSEVSHVPA